MTRSAMRSISLAIAGAVLAGAVYGETIVFGDSDNQFSMEFVEIGNPGNPIDPRARLGKPDAPSTTFQIWPAGAVDYGYSISKFEVSLDIVKLVDAVAGIGVRFFEAYDRITPGGIVPRDAGPALVSWIEAARVVNWLNTSMGYPPAYRFSLQPGDPRYEPAASNTLWREDDEGYDPDSLFRNSLARFVLPNIDEWHKAAYYDPEKDDDGGYWLYTTGSDQLPTSVASGTEPGTTVSNQPTKNGPADVDQAGGLSPYGVMGMGGNAREWTENTGDGGDSHVEWERDNRGQRWDLPTAQADKNVTNTYPPAATGTGVGFRVVDLLPSIPPRLGDFDSDRLITAADMDLLSMQVASMTLNVAYDLNDDDLVDQQDRTFWIEEIAATHFGDANLDKAVDFADFTALSSAFNGPGGWAQGDFDGNGQVAFSDFLMLSTNYNQTAAAAVVPEPYCQTLLAFALCSLGAYRRWR